MSSAKLLETKLEDQPFHLLCFSLDLCRSSSGISQVHFLPIQTLISVFASVTNMDAKYMADFSVY